MADNGNNGGPVRTGARGRARARIQPNNGTPEIGFSPRAGSPGASSVAEVESVVSGYSAMTVTEDGSGSTRVGSDTMSMTTITQAPSDESLTQKRNEYLERLSNRAIVVTRPKDFVKQGKKGQTLDVITNYFFMNKKPNFKLNQYRVDFSPREDLTYIKKQLLASHSSTIGAHIFDGHMLYMTSELKPENQVLQSMSAGNKQIYTLTLRLVGEITPDDPAFLQFYNTVMRKTMSLLGMEELGRNFYDRGAKIVIQNAPLELWPGYITAIRNHEAGILLCAEVTHKVLRTTTVLALISEVLSKFRDVQAAREEIKRQVVGQIVMTHYNRKTYRIDDIDFDVNPSAGFTTKSKTSDGEEIETEMSYKDYYTNRYGIRLSDTDMLQPLLVSHPRKKDINKGMKTNIILLPSLANLTGLSDDMRKDFRLMQSLSTHLHMDPVNRKKKLDGFMHKLKTTPQVVEEFKLWDVEFSAEYIRSTARKLGAEEISLSSNNETVQVQPDNLGDWTSSLRKHQLLSRKPLQNWILYCPNFNKEGMARFIQSMRGQATQLGMTVEQPLETIYYNPNSRFLEAELGQPMARHKKTVEFVIFVLPNNQLQRYAAVKKLFVLKNGIPMQCFLAKNLENKNFNSVLSKMMIQINAKLGGEPWCVKVPFKSKVMILGYDVYHCSERKGESVGALVATTSDNLAKYFSVVSFHKDKSELSTNMCLDTKKCLNAFKLENGCLPDRVILYRDGVGEGQINFVLKHEKDQMKAAICEEYVGMTHPKFTFIIVTKKINTRFLVTQGNKLINPAPGTILDDTVTLPERYDFFLVSQNVRQGTVSPTNYNVIYDESRVAPDSLQILTNKLCHLYFNWSGTVAVPAPCQYAHKLAYLTGVALSESAPECLSHRLWYL